MALELWLQPNVSLGWGGSSSLDTTNAGPNPPGSFFLFNLFGTSRTMPVCPDVLPCPLADLPAFFPRPSSGDGLLSSPSSQSVGNGSSLGWQAGSPGPETQTAAVVGWWASTTRQAGAAMGPARPRAAQLRHNKLRWLPTALTDVSLSIVVEMAYEKRRKIRGLDLEGATICCRTDVGFFSCFAAQ